MILPFVCFVYYYIPKAGNSEWTEKQYNIVEWNRSPLPTQGKALAAYLSPSPIKFYLIFSLYFLHSIQFLGLSSFFAYLVIGNSQFIG